MKRTEGPSVRIQRRGRNGNNIVCMYVYALHQAAQVQKTRNVEGNRVRDEYQLCGECEERSEWEHKDADNIVEWVPAAKRIRAGV